MASINIEQRYGARGPYNGRYVSPDTPGKSHHATNICLENREGISRTIYELTYCLLLSFLMSALIHCAGRDQSSEKLQLSQIRAPRVRMARAVQPEMTTNHCVRKSRFNPSLLSTLCPGLRSVPVCVCLAGCVKLSESISSIPNNFLSPFFGSS